MLFNILGKHWSKGVQWSYAPTEGLSTLAQLQWALTEWTHCTELSELKRRKCVALSLLQTTSFWVVTIHLIWCTLGISRVIDILISAYGMMGKQSTYLRLKYQIEHCKNEMVILTLLRLSQLQLNDIMSPTHWVYSSPYTLETEGMWAMCRVSPGSCGGLSSRVNDSPIVYRAWQRSDHPSWAVYPSPIKFLSFSARLPLYGMYGH